MKLVLSVFCILFLLGLHFSSLSAATLKGKVVEAQTGQILVGANIQLVDLNRGTISNARGEFIFKNLAAGKSDLVVSFIGFEKIQQSVQLDATETRELKISLEPEIIKTQGITITTTRYQKELDDVALPISVVSKDQMQQQAPVTLVDAVKAEPGMALSRDGAWGTRLVVRGLSNSNLVTLVDGNRIDTSPEIAASFSMVDVQDIERIEVIRGAGSSLYGTGAIGGVVNVITRSGFYSDQMQFSGALSGGYASVNALGSGHARITFSNSFSYIYASSMLRSASNTQTPDGELNNSQFNDQNFSVKAGFRPWKNHELKFNYQKFDAEDVGIPGGGTLFPAIAKVRYPTEARELFSAEALSRNWTSWLRQTSLKYFSQDITRDVENIPHTVKSVPGTPPKRVNVLKVTPGADHLVDGLQAQADWLLAGQYLVSGVEFWQKEYRGHRSTFQKIEVLNPVDNSVTKIIQKEIADLPLPDSKYASLGLFAQNESRLLADRLVLTLGGRYDWIRISNTEGRSPVYEITDGVRNEQPTAQKILWPAAEAKNHSWSGNANLLFHLHSNLRMTLTTAQSFRSPSLEERYQYIDLGSLVKLGEPNLEPETGTFGDLGFQFKNDRIAVSTNFFWNELKNLVIDQPTTFENRAALIKTNVGQARLIGFDGRVDFRLHSALTSYGTMGWVRGEDTQTDTPLPLIPPLNGRLGLNWRTRYATVDFATIMFATQDEIATGEIRTPGYTTFDLFVISQPLRLGVLVNRLVFGIENLTNHSYRNHLATNRGLVVAEPGRNFILRWSSEF